MKKQIKKQVELIWRNKYLKEEKKLLNQLSSFPVQTTENYGFRDEKQENRNKLILGENKFVMTHLLKKFHEKINLIYIDPPFATGSDFKLFLKIGDESEEGRTNNAIIETKIYRDTWSKGLDSYLMMMYERLKLMKKLLAKNGTIYVHLDYHVSHYIKIILDEIFGFDRFLGEIIWKRTGARSQSKTINIIHDVLLVYTKSKNFVWNQQYLPYSRKYLKTHYRKKDDSGRIYQDTSLIAPSKGYIYEWKGINKCWRVSKDKMNELEKEGRLYYTKKGVVRYKRYLDEMPGTPLQSVWNNIPAVNSQAYERLQFTTQKPELLLKRIILTSSNPEDIIADFFCGSGTALAVAEKLNRFWLGVDLSIHAINTTKKRLLDIQNSKDLLNKNKLFGKSVRSFDVIKTGMFERLSWQERTFQSNSKGNYYDKYRSFIHKHYSTESNIIIPELNNENSNIIVYIGRIDTPVTIKDIIELIEKFRIRKNKELHILGWEWETGINRIFRLIRKKYDLKFCLKQIPNDFVGENFKKTYQDFFELSEFSFKIDKKQSSFRIELNNFIHSIPTGILENIDRTNIKWSDWIDFWAIDFNFDGTCFNCMWNSFRTNTDKILKLTCQNQYNKPGNYTILIKVVDIFGVENTEKIDILI